jgi:hypothetical protein
MKFIWRNLTMELFERTLGIYNNYLGARLPHIAIDTLTFEEWNKLPKDAKATALFCRFYNAALAGYFEAEVCFVDEDEYMSLTMQYLMKNVEIIEKDPKRYKDGYIRIVVKNACWNVRNTKRAQGRYLNDTPLETTDEDGHTMNVLDKAGLGCSDEDVYESDFFWELFENTDVCDSEIIQYLAEFGKLPNTVKRSERKTILLQLRVKLADTRGGKIGIDTFEDILCIDDNVEYAEVIMPDGKHADYYGEKVYTKAGKLKSIIFFGAEEDYMISMKDVKSLKVVNYDLYK